MAFLTLNIASCVLFEKGVSVVSKLLPNSYPEFSRMCPRSLQKNFQKCYKNVPKVSKNCRKRFRKKPEKCVKNI